MNQEKPGMKATTLRSVLVVIIILILIIAGGGFYFAQQYLQTTAANVSQSLSNATVNTTGNNQGLKETEQILAANQGTATKAIALLSSSQGYQAQVVHDLGVYAANTGVDIQDYNFAPSTTATPATGAGVGATTAPGTTPPPAAVGGTGSTTFTVTITSPVSFTSLMKFMTAIEQSVPKMQIAGINLSASTGTDMVTTDALTIAIYTR